MTAVALGIASEQVRNKEEGEFWSCLCFLIPETGEPSPYTSLVNLTRMEEVVVSSVEGPCNIRCHEILLAMPGDSLLDCAGGYLLWTPDEGQTHPGQRMGICTSLLLALFWFIPSSCEWGQEWGIFFSLITSFYGIGDENMVTFNTGAVGEKPGHWQRWNWVLFVKKIKLQILSPGWYFGSL